MGNSSFSFRQFSIQQERCAMKVGTDGVLLGAWCEIDSSLTTNPSSLSSNPSPLTSPPSTLIIQTSPLILDIGAGTGLISLMLAQRYPCAVIDAVEIDPDAAQQCRENFEASPWSNRLHIHPIGLQEYTTDRQYDLIVTNPPFYNATLKPSDEARASARHFDSLPTCEIIRFAVSHLSPTGTLAMIFPKEYENFLMTDFATSGLSLTRICDIVTREGKPAKRRMIQLNKSCKPLETSMLSLRDKDNNYTEEYRRLTEDFYLSLS